MTWYHALDDLVEREMSLVGKNMSLVLVCLEKMDMRYLPYTCQESITKFVFRSCYFVRYFEPDADVVPL